MKDLVILILPGWQDSGPEHWQSLWLKKYPNAIKVEQLDWMHPNKQDWVAKLNEFIERESSNGKRIILVGHSLACATIAHWSKEFADNSSAKINGALLVGPGDVEGPNFPKEITGYSPMPIEKLKFKSIVVTSDNDPYVSTERAKFFSNQWGAELVNIGPHGHINADAGFGEWPEGERLLEILRQNDETNEPDETHKRKR